ncbi:MAG: hypothetical protein ACR2P2_03630 [Nakamurella sp.]
MMVEPLLEGTSARVNLSGFVTAAPPPDALAGAELIAEPAELIAVSDELIAEPAELIAVSDELIAEPAELIAVSAELPAEAAGLLAAGEAGAGELAPPPEPLPVLALLPHAASVTAVSSTRPAVETVPLMRI